MYLSFLWLYYSLFEWFLGFCEVLKPLSPLPGVMNRIGVLLLGNTVEFFYNSASCLKKLIFVFKDPGVNRWLDLHASGWVNPLYLPWFGATPGFRPASVFSLQSFAIQGDVTKVVDFNALIMHRVLLLVKGPAFLLPSQPGWRFLCVLLACPFRPRFGECFLSLLHPFRPNASL